MSTLAENITRNNQFHSDLRDLITENGGTIPADTPCEDLLPILEDMFGGGGQDTQQLIDILENTDLFSLSIPSGITMIGTRALAYSRVSEVTIPSSISAIGEYAFQNSSLASIIIPSTVLSLGTQAFSNCYSLESVSIPSTIETIRNSCFTNCQKLTSLILKSGIKYIEPYAFSDCERLPSVKLPSTILTIGQAAFLSCRRLALVDLTDFTDPTAIPSLANKNAFQNISASCAFLVANVEMQAAFSSATNWSNFTFTIQGA
jgi:hypothetical protein